MKRVFVATILLALGPATLFPLASLGEVALDRDRCPRDMGCFNFLWPEDPARPGEGMVELKAEFIDERQKQTPLGTAPAKKYAWRTPAGEIVAESLVIELPPDRCFKALVFETEIKKSITAPTGKFAKTHFALPAVTPPQTHKHNLGFVETAFAPPTRMRVAATGPVMAYSDDLEAMVISPLDRFLVAINAPKGKQWRCGIEGMVEEIPAGYVHKVLVLSGKGINATFDKWGEIIRTWHGHQRQDPYRDIGVSHLGYYTDNGAYYYYKTAPGMNEHQTMMAVREEAIERDIPYAYFQLDSWWYPKRTTNNILAAFRGGSIKWEPIPEKFPRGLTEFQKELGLPLVAHNRWYDRDSPYCRKYKCVYGRGQKKPALPIEENFWDEIMDNALSYGVRVYEQDWLITQMDLIPWLRSGLYNAEHWFDAMAAKADERGLTMQLCMASPGFFLQQMKHPNVTHVRCSGDYLAGAPKTFFWPHFHQTSMLAHATGMWPWKDVHMSKNGQRVVRNEWWPFEETLIANLSAGPVGPGDKLGMADRELLMRTCRQDGMLLKPDRPATPIDLMFVNKTKPWIVSTESVHQAGKTLYLAAFNLWPCRMIDPRVSFGEIGIKDDYALLDWRTREISIGANKIEFGNMPLNKAHYYVLCPIMENGMFVIGEADKFVTVSKKRFPAINYNDGYLYLEVAGVPGEVVPVSIYVPGPPQKVSGVEPPCDAGKGVMEVNVVIPESGLTVVTVE